MNWKRPLLASAALVLVGVLCFTACSDEATQEQAVSQPTASQPQASQQVQQSDRTPQADQAEQAQQATQSQAQEVSSAEQSVAATQRDRQEQAADQESAQQQAAQQQAESTAEAEAQAAAEVEEEEEAEEQEAAEETEEEEAEEDAMADDSAFPSQDTDPAVAPSETNFKDYEESVWALTADDDTGTFALDSDRASWSVAINYVRNDYAVEPSSVRPEEWVNAHDYQYPSPNADNEFGITLDLIKHPLKPDELHLLRIGLQAPLIERTRSVNVIFVADASGSMAEGNRLDIARAALQALWASLVPDLDRVGYLQFSFDPIPSSFVPHTRPDSEFLQASIDRLLPYYGTNVQAGINLGVQLANDARQAWPDSDNYVVLISDGVANVDATDPFAILESAGEEDQNNPIRLITIGVGIGHYNDVLLEQLAQYGNGWYYYMDSPEQAWETFTPENWLRMSTPFADQSRAQLRWNSETVESWRVIGYENRRTSDESFSEDRKEFAELPSGTAVTIFVELELTEDAKSRSSEKLELGDVEVRWLTPRSDESNRQEARLAVATVSEPDPLLQLGAIVALAADRYGSLEYVGDPESAAVNAELQALSDLLHSQVVTGVEQGESVDDLISILESLLTHTSQ